jgi:hypothetical protein
VLSHGSAGAPDVVFLDHALRSLGYATGRDGDAGLPDLTAVRMVADRLELRLEAPHRSAPPPPWTVDYSGCCWSIGRNDPLPVDAANAAAYLAPYPALVGVGYGADGGQWLLDLERAGSVSAPVAAGGELSSANVAAHRVGVVDGCLGALERAWGSFGRGFKSCPPHRSTASTR